VFSYTSTHADAVTIAVGANNYVAPGPALDVGQRDTFEPGVHVGGATFMWDCTHASFARWLLRDGAYTNLVTATSALTECPALP